MSFLMFAVLMAGCTPPASSPTSKAITTNWLVAGLGEHSSGDGIWKVSVPATNQPFELIRGQPPGEIQVTNAEGAVLTTWLGAATNTYRAEGWRAHPGWFIFIEDASRAWCYDGSNYLWLLQVDATGAAGSYGPRSFPCPVPPLVRERLSDSARKAMTEDKPLPVHPPQQSGGSGSLD